MSESIAEYQVLNTMVREGVITLNKNKEDVMSEANKAQGPIRMEVGKQTVMLTGAQVKKGSKNDDTEILHITLRKVLPNGDLDDAYKPIRVYLGVNHPSEQYISISSKKADVLLKSMGIEDGLGQFNGDVSVIASKEFKKKFGTTEFEIEVYEKEKEESFTNDQGQLITFKRREVSLRGE